MPAPATASCEAYLVEVFSSLQGEGIWLGCREIFLRLAECNLDCAYCDTQFARSSSCQIEQEPGRGTFASWPNPVALSQLLERLDTWLQAAPGLHRAINLTGGEPLLQAEVLRTWLPDLQRRLPIHLETNGTLPEALRQVRSWLAFISLDLKLASTTGQATPWAAHERFLAEVKDTPAQVKIVVGQSTGLEEVTRSARLVAEFLPRAPLLLQPVTEGSRPAVSGATLLRLQAEAACWHRDVRVIPQVHPLLQVS